MMDFADLGWRDAVLVVVAVAGVYLVLTVLRLFKVGRGGRATELKPTAPAFERAAPSIDMSERGLDILSDIAANTPDLKEEVKPARAHAWSDTSVASAWQDAAAADDFSRELARTSLEGEMQQLRRESTLLRDEVDRLRAELSSLRAARNVSPLYNEAMSLAQSGVSADGIAGQCGISLAEAELVAALARGRPDDENDEELYPIDEEQHGGHSGPRTRTGTHG